MRAGFMHFVKGRRISKAAAIGIHEDGRVSVFFKRESAIEIDIAVLAEAREVQTDSADPLW